MVPDSESFFPEFCQGACPRLFFLEVFFLIYLLIAIPFFRPVRSGVETLFLTLPRSLFFRHRPLLSCGFRPLNFLFFFPQSFFNPGGGVSPLSIPNFFRFIGEDSWQKLPMFFRLTPRH